MNDFKIEQLIGKFNVIKSEENHTVFETALKGWEENPENEELEEVLQNVTISAQLVEQQLILTYTVGYKNQAKTYYIPDQCTKLNTVNCGITENEVLDIDFITKGSDKAYLHFRYGDDLQIDNELIELIGENEVCQVYPDCEGYWCLEDLLENI